MTAQLRERLAPWRRPAWLLHRWLMAPLAQGGGLALILAGLVVTMALFIHHAPRLVGQTGSRFSRPPIDSVSRWQAARAILAGGNPYGPEVTAATQTVIMGRPQLGPIQAYVYPLPWVIWWLPVAAVSLEAAGAYTRLLGNLFLNGSAVLAARLGRLPRGGWSWICLVLLLAGQLANWDHVLLGQNLSLGLALALAAALAYRVDRPLLGGVLLAVALARPPAAFLLAPALLLHAIANRRWSLPLAMIGGGLAMLGISWTLRPHWPQAWWERVSDYSSYNTSYLLTLLADQTWLVLALQPVVALVAVLPWWWARRQSATEAWYAAAVATVLAATLIIFGSNGAYYSLVLLAPTWALLLGHGRPRAGDDWLAWTALLMPSVLAAVAALFVIIGVEPVTQPWLSGIPVMVALVTFWQGPIALAWVTRRAWRTACSPVPRGAHS